jgi:hypothetical protein
VSLFRLDDGYSQTLQAVFEDPIRSDIRWSHLKHLFLALGGAVKEDGDRVYIVIRSKINTTRAIIHCRHKSEYASTHAVSSIQRLLKTARIGVVK